MKIRMRTRSGNTVPRRGRKRLALLGIGVVLTALGVAAANLFRPGVPADSSGSDDHLDPFTDGVGSHYDVPTGQRPDYDAEHAPSVL